MTLPRTTLKDVALKAGVHPTTVSMALRNSGKLPEATRQRLLRLAQQMGYRQDPMLSALNTYRAKKGKPASAAPIALLYDYDDAAALEKGPRSQHLFREGIEKRAFELGYRVEPFFLGGKAGTANVKRLERIWRARGITGVLVSALRTKTKRLDLAFEHFSVVQIESQHLKLPLHTVSPDQMSMAREAVRRLAEAKYQRIGIAVGREEEEYLDHAFSVGFTGEAALHARLVPAPPLLLENGKNPTEVSEVVCAWIACHKLEAVISNWLHITDSIAAGGAFTNPRFQVVKLGFNTDEEENQGVVARDLAVGECAMEQLSLLLKTNQTGYPHTPNRILIPGYWNEAGSRLAPT